MARNVFCPSVIGGIFCTIFAAAAHAGFKDDIGYTKLQSELGASTPDGANVIVAQNELGYAHPTEYPLEFPDLDFQYPVVDNPPPLFDEHTTITARYFIGNQTSIAPGVPTLMGYDAQLWVSPPAYGGHVNNILNLQGMDSTISGGPLPAASAARVTSHGIVYSSTSAFLRRVDWLIDTDEALQIAAHGQGGLPMAYNTISVGISAGTTNGYADLFYGPWQNAAEHVYNLEQHLGPTLVADSTPLPVPSSNMSNATPVAASVAVLLVQTGHDDANLSTDPVVQSFINRAGLLIRNAERSEVIKAVMMAGALRNGRYTADDGTLQYLPKYRDSGWQDTNGLDTRVGAGQVNIRNSYYIIAAGEQNSSEDGGGQGNVPGSGGSQRGFDYDPHFGGLNGTNGVATYVLPTSATPRLLTASLVWNITVVGDTQANPGVFDGTTSLYDLKLSVIDTTVIPTVVASSDSAIENTENIWFKLQANHQYQLLVERGHNSSAFDWDYGLAWQAAPDTDGDGVPDEQDNCRLVANNGQAQTGPAQNDSDGDGYGNMCDADLNNSGLTSASDYNILRAALNTNNANADLNGSGLVSASDYNILRARLNTPPGPSGYCGPNPTSGNLCPPP